MKTIEEKLQETLKQMPNIFTSRDFCAVAREKGVPDSYILKGGCAYFYKKYTELKYENPKRWQKLDVSNLVISAPALKLTEAEAIEFLKSKGYKIMKPKTGWEEV